MDYELATIKDIFDKVPADKIGACMHELTAMLIQAAALRNIIKIAAESFDMGTDEPFEFPDFVTWSDDEKGNIDITLFGDKTGEEFLSVRTTLSGEAYE